MIHTHSKERKKAIRQRSKIQKEGGNLPSLNTHRGKSSLKVDSTKWSRFMQSMKGDGILSTAEDDGKIEGDGNRRQVDGDRKSRSFIGDAGKVRVWSREYKQWLTAREEEVVKMKEVESLKGKNASSAGHMKKILTAGIRFSEMKSVSRDFHSASARDREYKLLQESGEKRYPIPVSELTEYVNSVIATNGTLLNNEPVHEKYGMWH